MCGVPDAIEAEVANSRPAFVVYQYIVLSRARLASVMECIGLGSPGVCWHEQLADLGSGGGQGR